MTFLKKHFFKIAFFILLIGFAGYFGFGWYTGKIEERHQNQLKQVQSIGEILMLNSVYADCADGECQISSVIVENGKVAKDEQGNFRRGEEIILQKKDANTD